MSRDLVVNEPLSATGQFVKDQAENTSSLALTKAGNVGIGTDDPGAKLEVAGDLKVNGKIKIKDWELEAADYVFEHDYDLMDLNDLEKYVNENRHLPEIPSADEIRKEGLNLSDLSMSLVKKVEELSLYVIKQNHTIENQQKRVSALEAKLAVS